MQGRFITEGGYRSNAKNDFRQTAATAACETKGAKSITMGRQIHFYMPPEDRTAFIRLVQEHDPVVVTLRDSDSSEVQPLTDLDDKKTLCFWNRKLLPRLERKWIPDPGYYRVDGLHTPTLEFSSSFRTTWEGKPGLSQGRLFGDFDPCLEKPPDFEKWYEHLTRWIRKNYRKSPTSSGGLRRGCPNLCRWANSRGAWHGCWDKTDCEAFHFRNSVDKLIDLPSIIVI